jgi:superfamily II DNA or RNA helicase
MPGLYRIESPFSRDLNAWVKTEHAWAFDGGKVLHSAKAWYLPLERLEGLAKWAGNRGWGIEITHHVQTYSPDVLTNEPADLTPWQRAGVKQALTNGILLAQWLTGSGKSRFALEVLKALGPEARAVIVAPKVVMRTWDQEQLPRWLGQEEGQDPAWFTMYTGRKPLAGKRAQNQPRVVVCSYGSMHRLPEQWSYDLIVYDECHYGIHGDSGRSKASATLSIANPWAVKLGLSATPSSTSLTDLWGQLHMLAPHRWGSYARWWRRYFAEIPVGYEDHTKPGPLRQECVDDFVASLGAACDYVGIEDVGDYLPPVTWKKLDLGETASPNRTPPDNIAQWRAEQISTARTRLAAFQGAIAAGDIETTSAPTAVIVYHRALGEALAHNLGAAYVSGELSTKQRHELLASAPVAVMTMRSVTEGLDLRRYTNVYVLEAYPVPLYLTQVLGRFVRLYAKDPVTITFCRLRGSTDDVVVHRLLTRIAEQGRLIKQGKVESGLKALLTVDANSEDFLAALRDAVSGTVEEDEPEAWESDDLDW